MSLQASAPLLHPNLHVSLQAGRRPASAQDLRQALCHDLHVLLQQGVYLSLALLQ